MAILKQLCDERLPSLIIFDLDGTLIDSVPDLAVAINAMLTDLSLPIVDEARVRSWVGNGAVKLVERALAYSNNAGDKKP